jgi:hypothetical protein
MLRIKKVYFKHQTISSYSKTSNILNIFVAKFENNSRFFY